AAGARTVWMSSSGSMPCRYGDQMGDADPHDESQPPNSGDENPVEPLEIIPYPVPIDAHDPEVGGRSIVRLFFQPGDHAAAPEVDLAEVVILETWERVSIGLVRRGVTGEGSGRSQLRGVTTTPRPREPRRRRPRRTAWDAPARGRVDGRRRPPAGAAIRHP